jgi:hypothetical protein
MKIIATSVFLFAVLGAQAACLPDSGTSHYKKLMNFNFAMKGIEDVATKFEAYITPELPLDHEFVINLGPENPRVNAEIVKDEKNIIVSVWGGMLSHQLMSPDTFLLLLCHEIGHLLGGPPLKSKTGWSSTEGQADYYSGLKCARDYGLDEAQFMKAALSLTSIYAEVTRSPVPQLNRCDETRVSRINYGYPIAQCRLDTILAGWKGERRPSCWYIDP